ncbi:NAD(P)H-binding protein [Streptomyces sp. NPDC013178]|uniref:SDR family oxidoreductase n=1 Tax=Streptomyces sp. NPDC013178 TaxID=3155118 RepID=UPI0033DF9BF4
MKVVVTGTDGLIGSSIVAELRTHGVEVGVLAGDGGAAAFGSGQDLTEALRGADVIVDVTDASSYERTPSAALLRRATAGLLEAAHSAGAAHFVLLSVLGAGRMNGGYFRAKALQEELARRSTIPHSIVRAAPFFESVDAMTHSANPADGVHVPPVQIRPVAADDIAATVAEVAVRQPLFGTLEVAGPEEFRLDRLIADLLAARGDQRAVVADATAPILGAVIEHRSLLPGGTARLGRRITAESPEYRGSRQDAEDPVVANGRA